jgi:hypothetical protein
MNGSAVRHKTSRYVLWWQAHPTHHLVKIFSQLNISSTREQWSRGDVRTPTTQWRTSCLTRPHIAVRIRGLTARKCERRMYVQGSVRNMVMELDWLQKQVHNMLTEHFWLNKWMDRGDTVTLFNDQVWYCNSTLGRSVKVKVSRNRPGVAQRVPGGLCSQISWHSALEGGEFVNLTHRPPLPQECSWYSFSLGAESTPGPWCGRKEICHWKIQWHHWESIPGPSD